MTDEELERRWVLLHNRTQNALAAETDVFVEYAMGLSKDQQIVWGRQAKAEYERVDEVYYTSSTEEDLDELVKATRYNRCVQDALKRLGVVV